MTGGRLRHKLFESIHLVGLDLEIEGFLRDNKDIEIISTSYTVDKKQPFNKSDHSQGLDYFGCLIIYREI